MGIMPVSTSTRVPALPLFLAFALLTLLVYMPGLSGGWVFDDVPNILDNEAVQPSAWSVAVMVDAAMSSPASQFKRPLASLSFAVSYLLGGLNPFGWKLANLVIHLANGLLLFWLLRAVLGLLEADRRLGLEPSGGKGTGWRNICSGELAALIAGAWLLLPINLTGVLYVVQRMEALAQLFVLLGLCGYVKARARMLTGKPGALGCALSLVVPALLGLGAKESAALLPLYAFAIECVVFRFRQGQVAMPNARRDGRVLTLFGLVLVLPMVLGLAWLLPGVLNPDTWVWRDFTLGTRLLSEARVVVAYIGWTLAPLPQWLSFYHDDFVVSLGLWAPWTTAISILLLLALVVLACVQYRRRPLVTLGVSLYLAGHVMTATILPLELVFEHRNYFASLGVLLVVVPFMFEAGVWQKARQATLAFLLLWWACATAFTAFQWGSPVRLAIDLAARAPHSARALYDYGMALTRLSGYDGQSQFTPMVYEVLEQAAALPKASALPYQGLLIFATRTEQPVKEEWWAGLLRRLQTHRPTSQDSAALAAMSRCAVAGLCRFPNDRMHAVYDAALQHPHPSPQLLAAYGDYLWNIEGDHAGAMQLIERAIKRGPQEPVYRITLARMAVVSHQPALIDQQVEALKRLNRGGRLDAEIANLLGLRARFPVDVSNP